MCKIKPFQCTRSVQGAIAIAAAFSYVEIVVLGGEGGGHQLVSWCLAACSRRLQYAIVDIPT